MEFDDCVCGYGGNGRGSQGREVNQTLFETIEKRWNAAGYRLPLLTFWNVQARQNNIPMRSTKYVNFVSGMSPMIFEQVMKNLTAIDLVMDKLNNKRYECIH